ncbi:MAG: hypothetical protein KDK04_18600 [Candidatus Competibacteraceae bacterium]|nr:hypothetical protein [Candidatus Competibacteraceae bacterium]
MSEMRINARLDEQTARDLQFLREALGAKSITEVLKYSLQQAAQDLRDQARAKRQKQLWRDSGLIGCIKDGPEDLSVNYKQYVAESLDEKHPQDVSKK